MIRSFVLLLIALLLVLTGCGGAYNVAAGSAPAATRGAGRAETLDADMPAPMEEPMFAQAEMDMDGAEPALPPAPPQAPDASPAPPAGAPKPASGTAGTVQKQAQPLLIYTANYTMAVFEATAAIDAVQKLAGELGGYLVKRSDRVITVRVPSNAYQQALGELEKLGDVLHREETVEDVTEAFYDLKTRLQNARAMRDRLEELLAQATKVEEALAVEKELARVTADIETMAGKLKRLRELIAFSTITVRFEPRGGDTVDDEVRLPFPWLDQLGLSNLLNL